ncbi:M1 family metallopeptidase [Flagellimonas halotolerans]|uniref:Aminopeptidase N n=1 Tax=Flagellimonas halotolerans TaxID=3112164 RepID=A0ABU6IMQ2_9FLAO|nr:MULTISPECIES: M1 family metallopeptidase [unclassified Allomuricauda]MEC3964520.1 M1 family metallopeptidase [Muricauda sp. SYSU M86414]MEC4264389.1 M1 family metallopeptidase [Muricauda sp. SYSU M84420]
MKLSPILVFFLFVQLLSAQIQDKVDFVRAEVLIEPTPSENLINGSVTYQFDVIEDVGSIYLDAIGLEFSSVFLDHTKIDFDYNGRKITIKKKLEKGGNHMLKLEYVAKPKQTVYFLGWDDGVRNNEQVWTQGQGKYTSHWLPSFDDMAEKVEFDLDIILKQNYTVIANGKLVKKDTLSDSKGYLWQFDMEKPMSSYLVGYAIADYNKKTIESSSGVPIELYYEPADFTKVEPTYRYSQQIFDFLENEIGVAYPWQNYKQVPVQDFLYAGMENTTCTIFSNQYVIDSTAFVDKNYVNVNAHELAHQWFGNLVTETSSEHHWLHEGFATFYAYLAEKDIFGEDYYYWQLLETANALQRFSGDDGGEALRNPNAGSLTFYEKGAWVLVMLRDRVGEGAFKKGVQNYLNKYAFKNVTIPNFIGEMEMVSNTDLEDFEKLWLENPEFPYDQVVAFLEEKNVSIKTYFELKNRMAEKPENIEKILKRAWAKIKSNQLKENLVLDYGSKLSVDFLGDIIKSEGLKVRQAIILSQNKISGELQTDIEGLLKDKSYTTLEAALYRLWSDFPQNRSKYLNETDGITGFPNKNIRLLWLTLALVSPEYNSGVKPLYFDELSGYTGSEHHFETRLLAFQYLNNIGGFTDTTLKNLVEACNHHVWHFKKSARGILNDFLQSEGNTARIKSLYPLLSQQEKQYLEKTLGE